MEKNVSFKIENSTFQGTLQYGDGKNIEIKCSLARTESVNLQKLYYDGDIFNFDGKIDSASLFIALDCHIKSFIIQKNFVDYKIDIGTLYLNGENLNTKLQVTQSEFKFSHNLPFFESNKAIYIKQYDCHVSFGESITIKLKKPISLKDMDAIIFELKTLFQILMLNKNVQTIEKFVYTTEEKKIEQILKYDSKYIEDASQPDYLLYSKEKIDSIVLNAWFDAKGKYGKIFSYLSGILKESSLPYLEFKYFALAQWMEAYSREYLSNKVEAIVDKNLQENDDKLLLKSQCQNNNFRKNFKDIFKFEKLNEFFNFQNKNMRNDLIHDIVCYRNHLTHLNKEDNLNHEQMANLYEILKNLIYVFIARELNVEVKQNMIDHIKLKYKHYCDLKDEIGKCKENHMST